MRTVQNLNDQLDLWYVTMREQDKQKAAEMKETLALMIAEAEDPDLEKIYHLLEVRFFLLLKDSAGVLNSFSAVGSVRDLTGNQAKYYYYFFNGIFLYDNQQYEESIESYLKAEPYLKKLHNDQETAEFKYKLSTAYARGNYLLLSVYESRAALALFQREYNFTRCADCENALGVVTKYIGRYSQSESHYLKALRLIEKTGDRIRKSAYLNNIGAMYSDQGLSETAISYLEEAHRLILIGESERIRNVYLLAKEYLKTNKIDKGRQWLEEGLHLAGEQENQEYFYRFQMLKVKFFDAPRYEEVYREGIAFFRQHEMWDNVVLYCEELASFYREQKRLEEAVECYDFYIRARETVKKKGVFV